MQDHAFVFNHDSHTMISTFVLIPLVCVLEIYATTYTVHFSLLTYLHAFGQNIINCKRVNDGQGHLIKLHL